MRGRTRVARVDADGAVLPLARFETTYQLARKAIARTAHARAGRAADEPVDAPIAYAELLREGATAAAAHASGSGALPGERHRAHASRQRGRARLDARRNSTKQDAELTDSMKMFKCGSGRRQTRGQQAGHAARVVLQGQRPQRGRLRPRRSPSPDFAEDHGEEPELVGCYIIDDNGRPRRLGFAIGNEFSDHVTERRNYLLLAHSKLRQCGVGPDAQHRRAAGAPGRHEPHPPRRRGAVAEAVPHRRRRTCATRFANLEYHHFKYKQHRVPGDVHLHFFGTATRELRRQHQACRRATNSRSTCRRWARRSINKLLIEPGGLALHETADALMRSQTGNCDEDLHDGRC